MRIAAVAAILAALAISCSGDSRETAPQGKGCPTAVHVFAELGASPQRQERIGQIIDSIPGVAEWTLQSNLEAYREFKKLYRKQPEIYEDKGPDDFPARFEVTLEPPLTVASFERALEGATTGIDRLVPGGCATEAPPT